MTDRIHEFLASRREDGPRLVVDLDVVRDNYDGFAKALPDTRVFYAVKANPAPEILDLLARLGSCFDTASVVEIEQAMAAGATPDRISFGNTIKKERDIARAYALGVRLFAVDCEAEVEKIARAAPGSKVFCRILCDGAGAEWPLSRKFGCAPAMAAACWSTPIASASWRYGLSFHVGSQQRNPRMWDGALKTSAAIFRDLAERGIHLAMINLGGGFPTRYLKEVPAREDLWPDDLPRAAQAFRQPHPGDDHRAGPRHGRQCRHHRGGGRADLEEVGRRPAALGLSRHRQVQRPRRDDGRNDPLSHPHRLSTTTPLAPCVIAGPSCDSVDVLYEKEPYLLPVSLEIGAKVLIEGTGAYTTTYSVGRVQRLPAAEVLRDLRTSTTRGGSDPTRLPRLSRHSDSRAGVRLRGAAQSSMRRSRKLR